MKGKVVIVLLFMGILVLSSSIFLTYVVSLQCEREGRYCTLRGCV